MTSSFSWRIPDYGRIDDPKLASPPFCMTGARIQAVIFPSGVGAGSNTHLSVFIRPIKSNEEVGDGEIWARDISCITVAVVKEGFVIKEERYGGDGEIEILGFRFDLLSSNR
jgi:hypothetical protein